MCQEKCSIRVTDTPFENYVNKVAHFNTPLEILPQLMCAPIFPFVSTDVTFCLHRYYNLMFTPIFFLRLNRYCFLFTLTVIFCPHQYFLMYPLILLPVYATNCRLIYPNSSLHLNRYYFLSAAILVYVCINISFYLQRYCFLPY